MPRPQPVRSLSGQSGELAVVITGLGRQRGHERFEAPRPRHDVLAIAKEDHDSVVELTRDRVTVPSRGGIDSYDPVLDRLSRLAGIPQPARHSFLGRDRRLRRPDQAHKPSVLK